MAVRVSARDSSIEIRTAVLAYKQLTRELRSDLNKEVRGFSDLWRHHVDSGIRTNLQRRILGAGVRIKAGNPAQLIAANSKRSISRGRSGGLVPIQHWRGLEYGSRPAYSTYDRRSSKGNSHKVKRRANMHLPARQGRGYVLGPAVRELLPLLASRWARMTIAKFLDALEEGR